MSERVEINDKFLATTQGISSLDIADIRTKETATKLVRAAQNMILFYLENRDLEAVKDTLDKVEAVEGYLAKKTNGQKKLVDRLSKKYGHNADAPELQRELEQLHSNRIVQNTVAEGRIRSIRDIGDWAIVWVDHGTHKIAGGINVEDRRISAGTVTVPADIIKQAEVLSKFLVTAQTLKKWMDIGGMDETELDKFLAPYLDESILNNMELNYTSVLRFLYPTMDGEKGKEMNLAPHLRSIYNDLFLLRYHLGVSQTAIDKGEPAPITQMQFIREQFVDTVEHINNYVKQTSELY